MNKATPTITWATPAAITYGTALSATQLNATSGGVAGTFVYTPAAGTVLTAGSQTLSATFTPTDTTDYTTATQTVSLTVNKATPTITWVTPAAITYGTALSATQLNATSTVAGAFVYTPASGTVLAAGTHTLSVTLTPTDTTDYTTATQTVSLTVNKATPTITWATPAAITYGTALSTTQLNASSGGVAGTFVYTPVSGAVLTAGSQTLSATFTPADTTDYTTASQTVSLTVNKATPTITWATPAAITYGTALSATQLNASSTVAGAYVYTPASGTVLAAGSQTLSVTFTPTDTTDYTTATQTVSLTVNKAVVTVTANNASRTYGTANPTFTPSYSGFVNGDTQSVLSGTPSLTTTATPSSAAGTYTITSAAGTLSAANYSFTYVNGTLTVGQAVLTVTANNQTKIYGQTLTLGTSAFTTSGLVNGDTISSVTLTSTGAAAGASVSGSPYAIVPSAATGTFTASNYSISYVNGTLTVNQATPTITWATPAAITYGTALSATQLNASSTVAGTYVYTPASGTVLAAGTQTLSVTLTPTDATDYTTATQTVSLTVNKATQTITVTTAAPASATFNGQFSVVATATSGLAITYSASGGCTNVGGTFTMTSGTTACSVKFDQAGNTNYNAATEVVESVTALKAVPSVTAWPTATAITYGQTLASSSLSGGTASVGGSYAFTTPTTAPGAGTAAQSVTFTPTDTTDYSNVTGTVNVTVSKATPVLTWATPAPITQGTALSATQLNATSGGVAGTFVYTPALGTVPAAGLQTLSVTFTPTDTTDYNTATTSVTLTVNQAPTITQRQPREFHSWTAGSFTATATGYPVAMTFSEFGALPSGVTLSTAGILSGTPAAGTGGSYPITITARMASRPTRRRASR